MQRVQRYLFWNLVHRAYSHGAGSARGGLRTEPFGSDVGSVNMLKRC